NPYQVDDVPVQRRVIDRSEVVRTKLAGHSPDQEPHPDPYPHEHVDAMQPSHAKVDAEKPVYIPRLYVEFLRTHQLTHGFRRCLASSAACLCASNSRGPCSSPCSSGCPLPELLLIRWQ